MAKARKDNKTIGITLRFWTNDLDVSYPQSKCKTTACWDSGVIKIEPNRGKGIKSVTPQPFQCLEDVVLLIKEIMRKQNIVMVSDNRRPRIMSPKRKSW